MKMEKINFKNKGEPGAIPASAENLNLMQDNTENAINEIKPSIITVGLNSNIEITGNTTIQLDKILSSVGNKFTLQNGGIKIGAGVSKIKVSGCLLEEVNPIGLYGCYICKNEVNLAHAINVGFNYIPVANQMVKTTCQPILADVQEGDVIYLNAYANQSNYTATLQTYNGRAVNVTIEEVIEQPKGKKLK